MHGSDGGPEPFALAVTVEAVTFDLDDTLLDGAATREAIARTCDLIAATARLDAARLAETNRKVWQALWPEVEDSWTLGRMDGAAVTLEAWRRTLRTCGRDDESLAAFTTQIHLQHAREAMRLFDDVEELLAFLKPRLPLALITNGASDTQRAVLDSLGVGHHFRAVVISGEVGVAKPDPSIFGIAAERLGVDRNRVWHVGDTLWTDVAGARGAGSTAVWLNRRGVRRTSGDPEPDHEIRSLRELPALLSRHL